MRFGSVCSGIEAASVAWGPLGWEAAWLSEIEAAPSAALAYHYPDVPNLGDMTALPAHVRSGEIEAPDVFCGGTPCQAFSVAGLRRSLDDARGNLALIFCEIANEIDIRRVDAGKPAAVVFWENVPGVLSTKDNAFGCFLAGLAGETDALVPPGGKWTDAGCVFGPQRAVAWRVLDAQYFGLAQRRRRVFVVASARDGFDPVAVLFEFEGVRRDSAPSRETGQDVTGTLSARTSGGGGLGTDFDIDGGCVPVAFGGNNQSGPIDVATARNACASASGRMDFETETFIVQEPYTLAIRGCGDTHNIEYRQDGTVNALLTPNGGRGGIGVGAICVTGDITHTLRAEGFDASEDGTGRGQPIIAFDSRQTPVSSTQLFGALGSSSPQAQAVAYDVLGTPASEVAKQTDVHTPLRARTPGQYENSTVTMLAHGMAVRRLTPVECERLQGFPDGYTLFPYRGKPTVDGPRYKALGNSWAVPVVAWVGRRIAAALAENQQDVFG